MAEYPEWIGKVVLIQVTSPSPTDSPALGTKVSELVDLINVSLSPLSAACEADGFSDLQGKYGSLHYQPMHHYHQTIEYALYADCCRGQTNI